MRVSVITTLFNYKHYIEETIQSFLKQNFDESEMIIVDDYSSDNPYDVIKRYEGEKVKYIRLDKNGGYSHAKNVGIRSSQAEVIVMLDADDLLTENSLKIRYEKLSEGYDFVHGRCIDCKKGKIYDRHISYQMWGLWLKNRSYLYVHAQGVMLLKKIHREIGLYDETLLCKSDREFFGRVFTHNYKIGEVSNPVAIYRWHKGQMHASKAKRLINEALKQDVLKKIDRRKTDLSDITFLE